MPKGYPGRFFDQKKYNHEYQIAHREEIQERHHSNYTPELGFRKNLWSKYRLTVEDYYTMVDEQLGLCAICHELPKRLYIDHDPKTGRVRGLLCYNCNTGLGKFKESPELLREAAAYASVE